jgi:hypothetical protein
MTQALICPLVCSIVADAFGGTVKHGFTGEVNFSWGAWLLFHERVALVIVTREDGGSNAAAGVAIDASEVGVVRTWSVVGMHLVSVGHGDGGNICNFLC